MMTLRYLLWEHSQALLCTVKLTTLSIQVQTYLELDFNSLLFVCSLDHFGFIGDN